MITQVQYILKIAVQGSLLFLSKANKTFMFPIILDDEFHHLLLCFGAQSVFSSSEITLFNTGYSASIKLFFSIGIVGFSHVIGNFSRFPAKGNK